MELVVADHQPLVASFAWVAAASNSIFDSSIAASSSSRRD
jgi:hypothetical protein